LTFDWHVVLTPRVCDEFAGKPDVECLPIIGERGWVLITKDTNVRRNQLEVEAILNAGVRAFVITATKLNHEQLTELMIRAMPKVGRDDKTLKEQP